MPFSIHPFSRFPAPCGCTRRNVSQAYCLGLTAAGYLVINFAHSRGGGDSATSPIRVMRRLSTVPGRRWLVDFEKSMIN
jgi:hypothetical protein